MDTTKIVMLESGYLLEKMDNEITVYHPTLATSLYLNETGALIWELCDGVRSISEMIDILIDLYPDNSEQIADDVRALIQRLLEKNIAVLR
jgi:Coenzyme PQQ synthesis protein D (PqqD)